ncbi:hypothetical protein [Ureibacillus acetophenoni]
MSKITANVLKASVMAMSHAMNLAKGGCRFGLSGLSGFPASRASFVLAELFLELPSELQEQVQLTPLR